ncbi:hypothetical protein MSG28_002674 [Choristoneura fumiferana]|uniref:Uncharacterized protein n=1 Tax=Choristoneura fumiferana TaxID=7141 RepID=A0ACC0JIX7_CHOFU|nr:hypothetical protein MSG28_002674 [Choristoneura fumiferana]
MKAVKYVGDHPFSKTSGVCDLELPFRVKRSRLLVRLDLRTEARDAARAAPAKNVATPFTTNRVEEEYPNAKLGHQKRFGMFAMQTFDGVSVDISATRSVYNRV